MIEQNEVERVRLSVDSSIGLNETLANHYHLLSAPDDMLTTLNDRIDISEAYSQTKVENEARVFSKIYSLRSLYWYDRLSLDTKVARAVV